MTGQATAPAAGTVLNALATGTGSAFAIDEHVTATVTLDHGAASVDGEVADHPDADTRLVEACVARTLDHVTGTDTLARKAPLDASNVGGEVRTESEVPLASGLKSSSAAANATVLATLDALGVAEAVDRIDACRIGVAAAREVGVTVTGAFDDASASMLGGVTLTDNDTDSLLGRETRHWDVLVFLPPERAYSADADVARCRQVASVAELVADLAHEGNFERAMTVNGLAFCAALGFDSELLVEAMPHAAGVSLSGTGPSFVAVGNRSALEPLAERWADRDGDAWLTTTQTDGARPT
jgi:shikimate kinase